MWKTFLFQVGVTQGKVFVQLVLRTEEEGVWPSGQRVQLAIRWSRIWVLLWSPAGFVPGRPQFKSSATRENSQLFASC